MIKQRIDWQSRRKNRIAIYCKKSGGIVVQLSRQNDWQNMEKKLFYKKGNIVGILYMSGSSKTHI